MSPLDGGRAKPARSSGCSASNARNTISAARASAVSGGRRWRGWLHVPLRGGPLVLQDGSQGLRELSHHAVGVRRLAEVEPPSSRRLHRLPFAACVRPQVPRQSRERLAARPEVHHPAVRRADRRASHGSSDLASELPALPRAARCTKWPAIRARPSNCPASTVILAWVTARRRASAARSPPQSGHSTERQA